MMLFHNGIAPGVFSVPPEVRHLHWRLFIDTAAESPEDIFPSGEGPYLSTDSRLELKERSMMVFTAQTRGIYQITLSNSDRRVFGLLCGEFYPEGF